MVNVVNISIELGYLKVPEGVLIDVDETSNYQPSQIVIITTGSQGEPMSALTRMANNDHKKVEILPGDTVIISATPIPGNEKLVSRTIDNLYKLGADVIYEKSNGVHVSGHASQEEIKMMHNLVRPKFFMPVHGEYRHLVKHAQLAQSLGMPRENIVIGENGAVIELTRNSIGISGRVPAGKILVDGLGVGDVGNIVLRDRPPAFAGRHYDCCCNNRKKYLQYCFRPGYCFPWFCVCARSRRPYGNSQRKSGTGT